MSRKAVLACTIGQSGWRGSDSTKDFCSLMRGASREEGRSCAGTPDGPCDHRSRSALRLPAHAAQRPSEDISMHLLDRVRIQLCWYEMALGRRLWRQSTVSVYTWAGPQTSLGAHVMMMMQQIVNILIKSLCPAVC